VQRFVGQVNAEQHTAINARKNRWILPMCIGAIILGFVFTIGTAYPMLYLVTGRWAEFYTMVSSMGNLSNFINAAPYIFGTGIVLIAGGIIGLITAIQSQME
jgi:predicted permease